MEEMTVEEYRNQVAQKKKSKYNAVKTKINGHTFDSKREAERFRELEIFAEAGLIECLQVHPSFEIHPAFKYNGKTIRSVRYEADFIYNDLENGCTVVEDVKRFF